MGVRWACPTLPNILAPALPVPVDIVKLEGIHINPTRSPRLEFHFRPPNFLTWIDVSPFAVLTAAEPILRFREMNVKKAIVPPLETGLRLAFAVIRVRQNDVASFEITVRYVFVQPNDSRLVCNNDASYSVPEIEPPIAGDDIPPSPVSRFPVYGYAVTRPVTAI